MPPFDFMGPRGPYPPQYRMGPPPNQVTSPQGQYGQVFIKILVMTTVYTPSSRNHTEISDFKKCGYWKMVYEQKVDLTSSFVL